MPSSDEINLNQQDFYNVTTQRFKLQNSDRQQTYHCWWRSPENSLAFKRLENTPCTLKGIEKITGTLGEWKILK